MLVCISFYTTFLMLNGHKLGCVQEFVWGADYIFLFFLERFITRGAQKNWETKNFTDPGGEGAGGESRASLNTPLDTKKFLKNKNPILYLQITNSIS